MEQLNISPSNHQCKFIKHQFYHHLTILNDILQNEICSIKEYLNDYYLFNL